jgi:predicted transposase YdaD
MSLDERSALDTAERRGLEKGLKQAAKGMLEQGATVEFIVNAIGLTEEEILIIKQSIKNKSE